MEGEVFVSSILTVYHQRGEMVVVLGERSKRKDTRHDHRLERQGKRGMQAMNQDWLTVCDVPTMIRSYKLTTFVTGMVQRNGLETYQ